MERIPKLLLLTTVIIHTVVLFQSGFGLSLDSLNADTGGAEAQCTQFKSIMTLAFVFAVVAILFSALPMLKSFQYMYGETESQMTKLLVNGSILGTLYLQAAATFQQRTLQTCGDFTDRGLVTATGVLTLLGFIGKLYYKQDTNYITIGSVVQ